MLERVSVYLEYQDHCSHVQWPPPSALVAKVSRQGESCKEACYREGECIIVQCIYAWLFVIIAKGTPLDIVLKFDVLKITACTYV